MSIHLCVKEEDGTPNSLSPSSCMLTHTHTHTQNPPSPNKNTTYRRLLCVKYTHKKQS